MNVKCPCCRKETEYEGNTSRPFCSERCKLIDLGDWASEKHRIPDHEKDVSAAPDKESEPSSSSLDDDEL